MTERKRVTSEWRKLADATKAGMASDKTNGHGGAYPFRVGSTGHHFILRAPAAQGCGSGKFLYHPAELALA